MTDTDGPTIAERKLTVIAKDGETPYMTPPQGGRLRVGNPGNKGGPGKPKDALRQMMREGLEEAIPALIAIVRGERAGDVVAAANVLARYGVGTADELETTTKQAALTKEERVSAVRSLLSLDRPVDKTG